MARRLVVTLAAAVALASVAPTQVVAADSIADFYKGKQIRIVVGSAPGGGYDLYARTVSAHLGKFVPGSPSVIVQNQPGAGSLNAANAVFVSLPQDGLSIAALQTGPLFEQIMGNQAAKFETAKVQWLASLNDEAAVAFTWHTSKVKTFEDLLKTEAVFGTSGPNVTEQLSSMLIHMFGAKIKQVRGYESVTRMYPAVESGEVEGMTTVWASVGITVPHFVKENKINILVQFALQKQPDMPNVPLILDLLTERYLAPEFTPAEAGAIWRFIMTQQAMARPYGVGPGVPADRVAALRKAFADMAQDKAFLADSERAKRDIAFMSGQQVQELVVEAAKTPKATLDKVAVVSSPPTK